MQMSWSCTVDHMGLSGWVGANWIRHETAYPQPHAGILPVPATQLTAGAVPSQEPKMDTGTGGSLELNARVVMGKRMSSAGRVPSFDRKSGHHADHTMGTGLCSPPTVTGIGRGYPPAAATTPTMQAAMPLRTNPW